MWKSIAGGIKAGFNAIKSKLSMVASKISWPATLALFFAIIPLALCGLYWFFGYAVSSLGIATISTGLTWGTALVCSGIGAGLGLAGGIVAQLVSGKSVKAQKKKIEQLEAEEKEIKKEKEEAKNKLYELEHGKKKKKEEGAERSKDAKKRIEKRRKQKKRKRVERLCQNWGHKAESNNKKFSKNSQPRTNLSKYKSAVRYNNRKKNVKNSYTNIDLTKYRKRDRYIHR